MNIARTYLWVVLSLFSVYILLCYWGPVTYHSKKERKIEASSNQLSGLIADFHYWEEWNPDLLDTTHVVSIEGEPFVVGHRLTLTRRGVPEELQLKYMLSDTAVVDEIFIQRSIDSIDVDKGWVKFIFKNQTKESTLLTIEMEQGTIPFFFRGMIWMMQSAHPLDDYNQSCMDNLERLTNGEIIKPSPLR